MQLGLTTIHRHIQTAGTSVCSQQPGSIKAHCALNHTVDPWFVIPVYDTLRREWAEKAGAIIERKHKE